jgi:TrmH family RNA methyltransferase
MKVVMAAEHQMITSSANSLLKEVRRSVSKGAPTADGFVIAESVHLLSEALRSGVEFKAVLAAESARQGTAKLLRKRPDIPLRIIDERTFLTLASTENSQGVIALVRPPQWEIEALFRNRPLVIVLDGVQDPGNAGSIVRSAEAFGASGVIFLRGTVSAFNPKTLRASAGSLFRLPFVQGLSRQQVSAEVRRRKLTLVAASAQAEDSLSDLDLLAPTVIAVGSEAHGVSPELRTFAQPVRIPTSGVESLNASVAAAVILYEAARQRSRLVQTRKIAETA